MSKFEPTNFFLYRWRYWIGYTAIGAALIAVLLIAGFLVPGGLSQAEMNAAVASNSLNFADPLSLAITNAPFHILQWLSMALFGATLFSIKLPSLILGFLTAIALLLLLRQWFKPNIAVLSAIIAVTTGQFLFFSQQGTADVLYAFWPTVILLFATYIARRRKYVTLWKVLFAISAALSLYTPIGIYVLLSLGLAIIFHPHLRFIVRRLSKIQISVATVLALVLLAPLGVAIAQNPAAGLELIGIPTTWPTLVENLQSLAVQYFGYGTTERGTLMTPMFGLASSLLMLFGLFSLIKTSSTTQSYTILAWLICLLPILILNPAFTGIMFVPLVLLLATGLRELLGTWYRLFPKNPYARIAGLVPLIILVTSLVGFGFNRYVYGYHYTPELVSEFSFDLELLPQDTTILRVDGSEYAFYSTVAEYREGLSVTTDIPAESYTATRLARDAERIPANIVTSHAAAESDRFYIYNNQ